MTREKLLNMEVGTTRLLLYLFSGIGFDWRRGGILYAYSSSFNLMPTASDGHSNLFETIHPMNQSKFQKLVALSVNIRHIPREMLEPQTFQQLLHLCSGIPRELLAFTLTWRTSEESNFDDIKLDYLENRRKFYQDRIKRLFNKKKMGDELVKGSVSFASRGVVGRPMDNVPQVWKHAGLVTFKNERYQLL